jgi:tetratricopeptide (TPR) repeat protein
MRSLEGLFKGRDAFLRRLRASLTRDNGGTAAIVSKALYGLGGIGKTRAAVEYAWRYREDYRALLFVQADSPDELRRNLANLTGPLQLAEHEAAEEEVRLHATLAWLRANAGWLLILNLDTPAALAEANRLMGRLAGGHVVLTSRLDSFARHVEPLELDVLNPDAAVSFLLEATNGRRRKAADDEARARELAEELGRLALALEQAAATIDKQRCGFRHYLETWRSNRERVVGWARPEITGYHHAVAVTWQTSVDQLNDAARHLLAQLAFLAPDPVPAFLLDVAIPGVEAEDQHGALTDLATVSLVTRETEGERFSVHRLVQDVTRRSLDAAASRRRMSEALSWVDAGFDGDPDDVRTWPRLDPLVPHVLSVTQWADPEGIEQPTARLMSQLGALFHTKSLHRQAEPLVRRALKINETTLGPDHPVVATGLNNLAELLRATNRLADAEPLYRRALAINEASFGLNDSSVAICLNNLAELLRANNRFADAKPLYRRALAINETSFGRDHPDVGQSLNNFAQLLQDTNRLAEAEPLMRRALAIDEACFGLAHPTVARDLNNLAGLLVNTNRPTQAEPLYRRALSITEASFGQAHPRVATSLNNLAQLLQDTNRLAEAEPLMRRALAIDEASFGLEHPTVARDLNNLAGLLRASDRLAESEPLYRRALSIHEASLGQGHPTVATCLNNLAGLLQATNRLAEAEPFYRRALTIDEASFGPDHPEVATDLNNLAEFLRAANRLAEAEPLMRRTLAIFIDFERENGHAHPHRDAAVRNYASLLAEIGKSEAEIRAALTSLMSEIA